MKVFFAIFAILSCVFIGNVEGAQKKSHKKNRITAQAINQTTAQVNQATAQVSQNEREILLQNCHTIKANVVNQFGSYGGTGAGAFKSSAFVNAVKQGITNYLNSIRTPTAIQLLNELQASGFRDFVQ